MKHLGKDQGDDASTSLFGCADGLPDSVSYSWRLWDRFQSSLVRLDDEEEYGRSKTWKQYSKDGHEVERGRHIAANFRASALAATPILEALPTPDLPRVAMFDQQTQSSVSPLVAKTQSERPDNVVTNSSQNRSFTTLIAAPVIDCITAVSSY